MFYLVFSDGCEKDQVKTLTGGGVDVRYGLWIQLVDAAHRRRIPKQFEQQSDQIRRNSTVK
ncbi:MAG: hypothetical protein B7Y58_05515 [Halothiobacillus sp. 35-54-62]|nr:MAG: hypothetical protein B7Y58_05515 [Halothiobacillus sp. 35-54-62]OZA80455.1 MAG: hypothetical protein B7X64_05900 [Halothiobacillus sp. 39-53-45]